MSIKQLIESLEPAQRANCASIVKDIEGMAELFNAPQGLIFQLLDEAGQDVLDSIETQSQLGRFMLDKLAELEPIYEVIGDGFRDAMTRAGEGGSTAYLADFPVFAGLVHTSAAMHRADAA